MLAFFEGAEDLKTVLAWEPREFFVRFMKRAAAPEQPPATAEVVGTVLEGPAQAHVVVRVARKLQGKESQKVSLISLKRSGGEWKVIPSEWRELAEAIRLSQSGRAVGKPGADAPDK